MKNIKWIFFDIGSTLVDESVAFRKRVEKTIANTNVSYDDFYSKMVEISKYNQNGYHKALEYYGLTMAPWNSDDEFVYPEAEECLRKLSEKYKIGMKTVWIKQGLGGLATPMTQEEQPNFTISNLSELCALEDIYDTKTISKR